MSGRLASVKHQIKPPSVYGYICKRVGIAGRALYPNSWINIGHRLTAKGRLDIYMRVPHCG